MNDRTISIIIKAQDKASSVMEGVGSKIGAVSQAMAKTALIAGAAIAGALVTAGVAAIKSAGDYEQSRVSFETMLGSASKARKMLSDLSTFAQKTPFELPEVVQGAKQLLAYGFTQQQLIPTMRRLGDLASGLHVPFNEIALAFGQVKVKGHLMGQETLQFTNAGIPLIQTLAKTMHKSTDEIYKMQDAGKISFSDVQKAIESLTNKGSQFGGMMDKQSHTFEGVVSNIKDSFGRLLRAAVGITAGGDIIKGGFFDKIKDAANGLMNYLSTVNLSAVTKGFADFATFLGNVIGLFAQVWGWATTVATAIQTSWGQLMNYLKPVGAWIATYLWPILQGFIGWIGSVFKKAWDDITLAVRQTDATFRRLGIPVNTLGILLGVLAAAILVPIAVLGVLIGIVVAVIAILARIISWIYRVVAAFFSLAASVASAMARFIGSVSSAVSGAIGWFASLPGRVGAAISGLWGAAVGAFNSFAANARGWASRTVSQIVGMFAGLPGAIGSAISSAFAGAASTAKSIGHSLHIPGFASGGFTGRGGMNQVAGLVHKGEYVLPQSMVNQETGLPKASGPTINFYGNITLSTAASVDRFADRFELPNYGVGV